jgi:hypothetical protein
MFYFGVSIYVNYIKEVVEKTTLNKIEIKYKIVSL